MNKLLISKIKPNEMHNEKTKDWTTVFTSHQQQVP